MNKFGIADLRYIQIKRAYGDDEDSVRAVIDRWGIDDINRGYAFMDYDNTGMIEVNRIDDVMAFETDEEAVEQAVNDGVKIIPIEELPEDFDRRYFGWVDTNENRKSISDYCVRLRMKSIGISKAL